MKVRLLASFVLSIVCGLGTAAAQNSAYDAPGFQRNREYYTPSSFENFDPATGGLILTFTDLVIPGNAGSELRFVRSFNSKNGFWTFGIAGLVSELVGGQDGIPNPWGPQDPDSYLPKLKTADGAERPMKWMLNIYGPDPNRFRFAVSDDFIRYDRQEHVLYYPDGSRSGFDQFNGVWRINDVIDSFGNTLEFTRTSESLTITQTLIGSGSRDITFAMNAVSSTTLPPSSMTFAGKTWTYSYGPLGLEAVTPPAGPGWTYDYRIDDGWLGWMKVGTPAGGAVEYDFMVHQFPHDQTEGFFVNTLVVERRKSNDGINGWKQWDFSYPATPPGETTVVEGEETRISYSSHRTSGSSSGALFGEAGFKKTEWRSGSQWELLEEESKDYQNVNTMGAPRVPHHRYVTRNGRTYTTTYDYSPINNADYNRPRRVIESGDFEVIHDTIYDHDFDLCFPDMPFFGPCILAPAKQQSSGHYSSNTWSTTTFDLNHSTGFMTGRTADGVHQDFEPADDGSGNLKKVTDGRGNETTFAYSWGVQSSIETPKVSTSRDVHQDSLVWSETKRGATTTFDYDNAFRLKKIVAPVVSETVFDYAGDGRSMSVSHGRSSLLTEFDAFARPVKTTNAEGVKTKARYDAEGHKTFESLPYTGDEKGDTIRYDALGRVTRREHSDGKFVTVEYFGTSSGFDVRITDENDHQTTQHWAAAGDPEKARLVGVTDAKGGEWSYEYNAIGALRKVIPPDGPGRAREWVYDTVSGLANRLKTERHPESGTVRYHEYDAVGNVRVKEDANGTTVTYQYDENNRLKKVTAGSHVTEIGYENNSDLRASVSVQGGASVEFEYDAAGRLKKRKQNVLGTELTTALIYEVDELHRMDYPGGRSVEFRYNNEGQPTRVFDVTSGEYNYAQSATYHPGGGLASYVTGNGLAHSQTYNPDRYWPTSISVGSLLSIVYDQHDSVGNAKRITTSRQGANPIEETLRYDDLDRLDRMSSPAAGSYGVAEFLYDVHGNRLSNDYGAYGYEGDTLRLASHGMGTVTDYFAYDSNGNLRTTTRTTGSVSNVTADYVYRPDNMMRRATVNGIKTDYVYDGDQQRVARTQNAETSSASTSLYAYGSGGQLIGEYRKTPTGFSPIREYIYLGSKLIASVEAPQARVEFATAASAVQETVGTFTVAVRLTTPDNTPIDHEVVVQYSNPPGGTASPDVDYAAPSGTVTFGAGSASGSTQTISITVNDDQIDEIDETFNVALTGATGAELGASTHTVTILDNEPRLVSTVFIGVVWPNTTTVVRAGFPVSGWALDSITPGTGSGVNEVKLYAHPISGGADVLLGTAQYGLPAPQHVIAQYGSKAQAAGFTLMAPPLAAGQYELYAAARFTVNGWIRNSPKLTITVLGGSDQLRATDYDGDSYSDMTTYNPTTGVWSTLLSSTGWSPPPTTRTHGGAATQWPVSGDFDGDGKTDSGVYDQSTSEWRVLLSSTNYAPASALVKMAGGGGYVPVPGDYDGDARTDFGVYNPTTGLWFALKSGSNYTTSLSVTYGGPDWTPVPGDYDGDGKTDIAKYRPLDATWTVAFSSTNWESGRTRFGGGAGWTPVPADYDGDGKADMATYNTTTGAWYVLKSTGDWLTSFNISSGGTGWLPLKGDFDGDGKADLAVYNANGDWSIKTSGSNYGDPLVRNPGGAGARPVTQHNVPTVRGALDLPAATDTIVSRTLALTGWAFDINALTGAGVNANGVIVYARPYDGGAAITLGTATQGVARADIAALHGEQFRYSGFTLNVNATVLPVGRYKVFATVRLAAGGPLQELGFAPIKVVPPPDLLRATDYDGDGRSDITVYNVASGVWSALLSTTGFASPPGTFTYGGVSTYWPVSGDFDGDGKADPAVYDQPAHAWHVLLSSSNYTATLNKDVGGPGWIPVLGDYDGDRKTDFVVYKEATAQWYGLLSGSNYTTTFNQFYGGPGYTPVPADYDGDGKTDIAAYWNNHWSAPLSSTNFTTSVSGDAGGAGWIPVAADYDGDGKADFAVYNTTTGVWYGLKSSGAYLTSFTVTLGGSGYQPMKGDFDGDGKADAAVYESNGNWTIKLSSTGFATSLSKTLGGPAVVPIGMYKVSVLKAALDLPSAGLTVWRNFTVTGWAFDVNATTGTGVGPSDVTLYAKPVGGGSSILLGTPIYGSERADVATVSGEQFRYSGFTLNVSIALLPAGRYTISTYVRTTASGAIQEWMSAPITVIVAPEVMRASDFDGDGRSDIVIFRPAPGTWSWLKSSNGFDPPAFPDRAFGDSTHLPVWGDFDGDGKADPAVYHQPSGNWTALLSGANYTTLLTKNVGGAAWTPVQGDYDGDRKTDFVVYNQSTGQWYGLLSGSNYTTTFNRFYGGSGYTPVPADYDGDGKYDVGTYAGSQWWVALSSTNFTTEISGAAGGLGWTPVAADYDGDGKADFAVYNTASGVWYGLKSTGNYQTSFNVTSGGTGWRPVKGDYDGDGRADLAVYADNGSWSIKLSSTNFTTSITRTFGGSGALPIPLYLPQ